MKKILLALFAFASMTANAQFSEFRPGVVAEGVNYALPRTGFKVDITTRKIVFTPGDFARFAERYLHLQNVQQNPETRWEISEMRFSQFGEPDSLKYFTVKMKDKSVASLTQLTEDGIIVAINTSVDLPTEKYPIKSTTSHRLDSKRYLTPEILAATSTSKMAELTAQEIFDVRESKNNIKRGQVESMPKDGASLKIVLDELNLQEDALMQNFVGYSDTITTCETFSIVPDSDLEKEVLFRFSKKLGLVDVDDVAGEPYYVSIKNLKTVPMPSEAEAKKRKINGLAYNMPSQANVKVFTPLSTYYDKNLPFGQFGNIDVLSTSLFVKESTVKIEFNPTTGALLHIDR